MPADEAHEAARLKIHTAIEEYLKLGDDQGDGALDETSFLNTWGVVAHVPPIESTGRSVYWTLYSSAEVPTHVAVGLFQVGADLAMKDYPE